MSTLTASIIWSEICRRLVNALLRPVYRRVCAGGAPRSYELRFLRLVNSADCSPCRVSFSLPSDIPAEGVLTFRGLYIELAHEIQADAWED